MNKEGFQGRTVLSFESRRALEMANLIERYGGVARSAKSMREVVIAENPAAKAFMKELVNQAFDVVVLMTGVGTRALIQEISPEFSQDDFVRALQATKTVIARGPKPASVLREIGVHGFLTVPEPNTWRQLLALLEGRPSLSGVRIAIQEYGAPTLELYRALQAQGASVLPIPVYRWALPEDIEPLKQALHAIAKREITIALFTSRAQVEHVFLVAAEEGIAEEVRTGLRQSFVASIGPVCSEALKAEGIQPSMEPQHPKMGHLVKEAAEMVAAQTM